MTKSSGVWDISDNVSKSFGQASVEVRHGLQVIRPSTFSALNGRGTFGFTGVFSQDPQNRSRTGSPLADLHSGRRQQPDHRAQWRRRSNAAAMAAGISQDQWSFTPSLTAESRECATNCFSRMWKRTNHMANFVLDPADPNFGQLVHRGSQRQLAFAGLAGREQLGAARGLRLARSGREGMVIRSSYGSFLRAGPGQRRHQPHDQQSALLRLRRRINHQRPVESVHRLRPEFRRTGAAPGADQRRRSSC